MFLEHNPVYPSFTIKKRGVGEYTLQGHVCMMCKHPFFTIARKEILTPNAYHYKDVGIDVSSMTSILFEVQACHDAHVLLMKTPADEDHEIIEIVIGTSFVHPLVTNGFYNPYHLDESTFICRGIRIKFSFLFHFSIKLK